MKKNTFGANQKKLGCASQESAASQPSNGDSHPPKKKIEVSAEIKIILTYSEIKKGQKATSRFPAQPAKIIPYTPMDVSANKYSRPASMFAKACSGRSGMTAQRPS